MRYLTGEPIHPDEAGYVVEEGVVLDAATDSPNTRKAYDEFTRYWRRSSEDLRAEEAAWAARSGPCVTLREPTRKAG